MIANVSPSTLSYEDTYNTLKYAMRAKKIKSNMSKNIVMDKNLANYTKIFEQLTQENVELKGETTKQKAIIGKLESTITELRALLAAAQDNVPDVNVFSPSFIPLLCCISRIVLGNSYH